MLVLALLVCCCLCPLVTEGRIVSAILDDSASLRIEEGAKANAIVWGSFVDNTTLDGWGYLEIKVNPDASSVPQNTFAYAMGAVETNLTSKLMETHYNNMWGKYCTDDNKKYCNTLRKYLHRQIRFMNHKVAANPNNKYWRQVGFMLSQLAGLDDAFQGKNLTVTNRYTRPTKMSLINWEGDILDLEGALNRTTNAHSLNTVTPCSAFIKVTDGDVVISHVAWYHYKAMLRIQKKYMLPDKFTISMSSYPGKLSSMDDFYITSNDMVVTETTNSVLNDDLWKRISTKSVPCWIRAMTANRLGTSGSSWVDIFKRKNSGSYNNQWMVLDFKAINGTDLKKGALFVAEQIPGQVTSMDMTDLLRTQKFWSSFNIPYFKDIYEQSGYPDYVKKYGNFFSHDKCARGVIFSRDAHTVQDMDSLVKLMRYNDYKNDPASKCNCTPPYNPTYAISSRYDLLDPNGTYEVPQFSSWKPAGAIDLKASSGQLRKDFQFVAINGPTYDQQPVFQWSTSGFNDIPVGLPDRYDFPRVLHKWGAL